MFHVKHWCRECGKKEECFYTLFEDGVYGYLCINCLQEDCLQGENNDEKD